MMSISDILFFYGIKVEFGAGEGACYSLEMRCKTIKRKISHSHKNR